MNGIVECSGRASRQLHSCCCRVSKSTAYETYETEKKIEIQDRSSKTPSQARLSKKIYRLWNMKSNISFRRFNIPAAAAATSITFFSVSPLHVVFVYSIRFLLLPLLLAYMSWKRFVTLFLSYYWAESLGRATSERTNSAEYHKMAAARIYSNFVADRRLTFAGAVLMLST